jgi:hypothetical protein
MRNYFKNSALSLNTNASDIFLTDERIFHTHTQNNYAKHFSLIKNSFLFYFVTILTLPNPKFSLFDIRRASEAGNAGGAR